MWLVALTARTFTELNEILSHVLDDTDKEILIKEVIRMSNDNFILHEWEKDKMETLVKYEEYEAGRTDGKAEGRAEGRVEGIEENITATIKAMLEQKLEL